MKSANAKIVPAIAAKKGSIVNSPEFVDECNGSETTKETNELVKTNNPKKLNKLDKPKKLNKLDKPKKLNKVDKRLAEKKAKEEKIKPAGIYIYIYILDYYCNYKSKCIH